MTKPTRLKKFVSAKARPRFEIFNIDSPDTGSIAGTFMATSFQAIPLDDPNEPRQEWIFTTWLYQGENSATDLPAGMRGSAIWNDDGDVLGFLRYAINDGTMKGWCVGVAADELIKQGYTLVNTRERT